MIFNMEFKSNFAKMISWAIVLIILLGLMLAFYPFLAESQMNSLFNSVLESFNEPTKNILGFYEGMDIVNIGDYLALVYHYLGILIRNCNWKVHSKYFNLYFIFNYYGTCKFWTCAWSFFSWKRHSTSDKL